MPHTPGPWRVYDGRETLSRSVMVVRDGATADGAICRLPLSNPNRIADANVMASSLDMLDALKAVDAQWASGNFTRTAELWEMVVAGIRKAEGRP